MNATSQLTEEHAQQIHDAIEEAQAENGEVIISFGVNRRFVKVNQLVQRMSIGGTDRSHMQPIREFEQYIA